jgi:hypothetical protein
MMPPTRLNSAGVTHVTKYQSLFLLKSHDFYYFANINKEFMYWRKLGNGLPFLEHHDLIGDRFTKWRSKK